MKVWHKVVKITALILGLILIFSCISFMLILEPRIPIKGMQKLDAGKLTSIDRTIRLLDDDEQLITESIYDKNKVFTPISKIPTQTLDAFIGIEDKRFYKHKGIDYFRIAGAIKNNLFSRSYKEGASTITQQLIKNTHLSSDKTLNRKIQELRIAKAIERRYSKNEILEMYLNILYFGNNLYGIGSAAQMMFQKTVEELTLEESALLAGIINNPSKYNPYYNYDNALKRRNLVLDQMCKQKKISQEQYDSSSAKPIQLHELKTNSNQYMNGVIKEATTLLNCKEDDLFRNNYTIGTFMNEKKQTAITSIMSDIILKNNVLWHAIVIENVSGRVISDYGNSLLNLAYVKRQPGSTIKPLLCYAPALEKKLIYPASPILDEKTDFSGYSPENYQSKYYGYISVADSLKYSLNVPAVKMLAKNGIEYSKAFAKNSGVTFEKEDNSLTLALGGMRKGLTLQQLANSYQSIANGGRFIPSSYIKYIKDADGNLIYNAIPQEKNVFGEDTAFLLTSMLKQCAEDGTAKKLSYLDNVAAKTGTVGNKNGNTDAYCVAYTPDYTVAVWYGAVNNKAAINISGGGYPTVTAGRIINNLSLNDRSFLQPQSVVSLDIDMDIYEKEHRVVLAGNDILAIHRKKQFFSTENVPKEVSYAKVPDIFSEDFNNLDLNNFEIVESLLH